MSSAQAKKGGKSRYFKKKAAGPPKGGDGQGDFKGSAMTQYRSQPLVSFLQPQTGTDNSPKCSRRPA